MDSPSHLQACATGFPYISVPQRARSRAFAQMRGKVMHSRHNAIVFVAAFSATILAGLAGISNADQPVVSQHPNNRANHHPVHESVRENEAVVTRLGTNATAVSYWASTPQGWQVLTTVDTVTGQDTDAEQH